MSYLALVAPQRSLTEDWRAGKITEEKIAEAIREHRERHPWNHFCAMSSAARPFGLLIDGRRRLPCRRSAKA